jgi:hypothetical protein
MNPFDLDDKVIAAAIAAGGTVIGALIQLRMTWRRELSERARGVPVSKKSRRGPVLAISLLLAAAAVGGFAASQVFAGRSDHDALAVRAALESQVAQISATAERLERATLGGHGAARAADPAGAVASATATATVAPCRARGPAGATAAACEERDADAVTLCASVPATAVVTTTTLYARPEDSAQPWNERLALPGQDLGRARFANSPFERPESEQFKQVCATFASWDGERAYSARLATSYAAAVPPGEVAGIVLTPVSGVRE